MDEFNSDINSRSNVEYIKDPQPDLFSLLTEMSDHLDRWKSFSFPIKLVTVDETESDSRQSATENDKSRIDVNCTVAFMSQCMSFNKCKSSCASMGANAYRWFHDGCCECVGQYCPEFGISQSECTQCPLDMSSNMEAETSDDQNSDTSGIDYSLRVNKP